jgi:predicted permease
MLPVQSGLQEAFSADPDPRVFGFTLLVALSVGVSLGLAPASAAAGYDVSAALKSQAALVLGRGMRIRKVLVAAQVGLSLLLLIGAGLFARTLYNLKNLDLGFRRDHLLAFRIDPKLNGYTSQQIASVYERVRRSLAAQPGVRSLTCAQVALLAFDETGSNVEIPGYQTKEGEEIVPDMNRVGPGFLSTLGIPLIAGRDFTENDAGGGLPRVAIVNEAFARRYFGTPNIVGRVIIFGSTGDPPRGNHVEIIGVAHDAKYASVRETTREFVYFPYLEFTATGGMTFYIRTWQDPAGIALMVRQQVRKIDPGLPVSDLNTMEDQVDDNLWIPRIVAALSISFGSIALILAAVGLYGVLSYVVARRTREIGIRMALGARRSNVLRMVMQEVMVLTGIGMAVAIPVTLALARVVGSQLYGISSTDPLAIAGAVILLAAIAGLAGYLPAYRATRIDPIRALRYE